MDFSWIFYAIALFVTGGTCFFTALAALVRLDQDSASTPTPSVPTTPSSSEPSPRLTKLGRPVRQIQIL